MQTDERLAYTIEQFAEIAGLGRSLLFQEIREGRLTARKSRTRTVILKEDALAYLRSLPPCETREKVAA